MDNQVMINEKFSIFGRGWRNQKGDAVLATKPQQTQDLLWVYEYITSERARWATETLRSMAENATKEDMGDFKKLNFEVTTFNGVFSYRNARSLVVRSPWLVADIDDLSSVEDAREVQQLLIADKHIETGLCFVSPKGRGVKWIVRVPEWLQGKDFKAQFEGLQHYVAFHHGITIDKSGSDVCRACFLPWDKDCFINHQYQ